MGLSLAIDLLRRGVSCRIIDRSSAVAVGTRARGISSRTQEIFESLGVLAQIRQFAEPSLPARFYDRNQHLVREMPAIEPAAPAPEIPCPNARMVSQQNTGAVLGRRLAELGGAVETHCEFCALTQNGSTVTQA